MKIYLASDHAGLKMKDKVFSFLSGTEYELVDFGPFEFEEEDDYPDYISQAARAVAKDPKSMSIVFGGSGQGEAISANRFRGVRASVYYGGTEDLVTLSRKHNNSNMLSVGARFVDEEQVIRVVMLWLGTKFSGDKRHVRRLSKLEYQAKKGLKSQKIERFGWLGVILILGAYIANVFGFLAVSDSGYLLANIVGSLFVLVDAKQDNNLQAVVINVVWIVAGLLGVFRYLI